MKYNFQYEGRLTFSWSSQLKVAVLDIIAIVLGCARCVKIFGQKKFKKVWAGVGTLNAPYSLVFNICIYDIKL